MKKVMPIKTSSYLLLALMVTLLISCDSPLVRDMLFQSGLSTEFKQMNGCRGCEPEEGNATIYVLNDLALPLLGIYISASELPDWGPNLISTPLPAGSRFEKVVKAGLYDAAVIDNDLVIREKYFISLAANESVTLRASQMTVYQEGEGEDEGEGEGEREGEGETPINPIEGESGELGNWQQYPDLQQEKTAIGQVLQSFQKAMREGDVEKSVSYIDEDIRGIYRQLFEQKTEAMASFADLLNNAEMSFLSPKGVSQDPSNEIVARTAEYTVTLDTFDFYIRWIKLDGQWRIFDF